MGIFFFCIRFCGYYTPVGAIHLRVVSVKLKLLMDVPFAIAAAPPSS